MRIAVGYVFAQGSLKQPGMLKHKRDIAHQLFLGDIAHVCPADADSSFGYIPEARDKAGSRSRIVCRPAATVSCCCSMRSTSSASRSTRASRDRKSVV